MPSIIDRDAPEILQIIPAPPDMWVRSSRLVRDENEKPVRGVQTETTEERVVCLALIQDGNVRAVEPMVFGDWIDFAEDGCSIEVFYKPAGEEERNA